MEEAINNMMQKINNDQELYEWFINYEPDDNKGYMWSNHPNINKISNLVDSDGHSGASFAICLQETKKRFMNIHK